jgi:hypothetical protein
MVYVYSAYSQSSFIAATDQLAIEITAPANKTLKIRRIEIAYGDGTATTTADFHRKVKIVTESVAGSGGSTYTPVPLDANTTASTSTVKTGAFTVGTIDKTLDTNSQHSTNSYLWQAVDEDDKIVIKPGGIFGVIVNTST